MHSIWKRLVIGLLVGLGLAAMAAPRAGAQSAVGVISGAPLKIQIFPDNGLQVWHNRYTQPATFGTAGSGFLIDLNTNIFGPLMAAMEFVSQDPTVGQGTSADPFRSVLRQRLTSGGAALVLTPGVMFGTPEAFEIEPNALNSQRRNRLLLLAGGVLLAILLGSWLPTILSDLVLKANTGQPGPLQSMLLGVVAGLQSLLLLIFVVTVQNLFLHMLALPETIGEMIKRRNRIAWFIALLLASYVYLQTLLNPNGDLAHSLETSNVRAFIGTIGLFLLFVVITSMVLRRSKPVEAGEPASMPGAEEAISPQINASPAASDQPGNPQPPEGNGSPTDPYHP